MRVHVFSQVSVTTVAWMGDAPTPGPRHSTALGERVLEAAAAQYTAAFGDRAMAIYALGSLAHGGFCPAVSDVDAGLILHQKQPGDEILVDNVQRTLQSSGLALAERLSVFWSSHAALRRGEADGRFPAADRLDLAEYGRLLAGRNVRPLPRPSTAELAVEGARFALARLADERTLGEIRQPELLIEDPVRFTKIVLLPVRLQYTGDTGKLGLTDAAVQHYLADRDRPARDLVCAAQAVRNGVSLEPHVLLNLAHRDLANLYRKYIDHQLRRLPELGTDAGKMVPDFRRWLTALSP
jgi:hypothetical protein